MILRRRNTLWPTWDAYTNSKDGLFSLNFKFFKPYPSSRLVFKKRLDDEHEVLKQILKDLEL